MTHEDVPGVRRILIIIKIMSKISIISAIILATVSTAAAQAPSIVDHITLSGRIAIYQPDALAGLVSAASVPVSDKAESQAADHVAEPSVRSGFRVQVFDDNNPRTARKQAEARYRQVHAQFPHLRSYVTFNSPYWRVKVGDFRTRAEAEATMAELRHAFPSMAAYMRIVRDKINTVD